MTNEHEEIPEVQKYQKVQASDLTREQQQQLREALIAELTETMINQVKVDVESADLTKIELVLRPGQAIDDPGDLAMICCTCGTCDCGTCGSDIAPPDDIPIGVIRELGISVEPLPVAGSLRERMDLLNAMLKEGGI